MKPANLNEALEGLKQALEAIEKGNFVEDDPDLGEPVECSATAEDLSAMATAALDRWCRP